MSVKLGIAPIAWSNDDMPELEDGEETIDEQDISNNIYSSDTNMLGIIETLLHMRRQRARRRPIENSLSSSFNSMINSVENSREVQEAILASIRDNDNNDNNDTDTDSD